jgi:invasion protein IalB
MNYRTAVLAAAACAAAISLAACTVTTTASPASAGRPAGERSAPEFQWQVSCPSLLLS